jgi:PPOX class probable F420-dependent enzyme
VALSERVRAFLDEPRFAVLATINPDGTAQQTVMWYKLDGDRIVMNTARGRWKDHNLLRDRRVSLCVEDGYRFVTISGEVELDDDQATAQADIADLAARYKTPDEAAAMIRNGFSKEHRITLRMSIDRVKTRGFGDEG